jgi:iron-sulfur cluster repair protein YtfE (RIC family)
MLPTETRHLLLEQHGRLRRQMEQAMRLASRLLTGEDVVLELRAALAELRATFLEHNESEEALLEPVLSFTDAWAPQRIERMVREHKEEHAMMREDLTGNEYDVARRLADVAEELEAHMQAEERTFLSPSVLRNDVITLGPTS